MLLAGFSQKKKKKKKEYSTDRYSSYICRMPTSLDHLNDNDDIITFNIGGQIFSTKRSTINENVDSKSLLSLIIKTPNDQYFIDRDGKSFSYILNYFREKKLILPENINEIKQLLSEAKFYQIDRLINEIENYLNKINEQIYRNFQITLFSKLNQNKQLLKLTAPL